MMRSKMNGFTLVELAVTCGVLAILLAVALPGLGSVVDRNRFSSVFHDLRTDMALARASAIMRRTQVLVCPREIEQLKCRPDGDWSGGWLVFIDPDRDRQPGGMDDILHVRQAPARTQELLSLVSNRPYLRYQSDGRAANTNLTLQACARGRFMGRLVVNNVGRVRSERPGTGTACPFDPEVGPAGGSP